MSFFWKSVFCGLAPLFLIVESANAWVLTSYTNAYGNKVYKVTCGDGGVGYFNNYPSESSLDKTCAGHGGVVNIRVIKFDIRQQVALNKLVIAEIEKIITDDGENSDVTTSVLDKDRATILVPQRRN